jgi:hypothetical protein
VIKTANAIDPEALHYNLVLSGVPEAAHVEHWQGLSQRSYALGLHHGSKTVYAAHREQQYYNPGSRNLAY